MIIYDQQNSRMVDTENGDYLLSQLIDRDGHWYFIIYNRHDQPLFGSIVEVIRERGNSGEPTLSRCTLIRCWIPSGRPEQPVYFDGDHPLIPRLAAFLKAEHDHLRAKLVPPRFEFPPCFEFIDGRYQKPATDTFARTQSYQQSTRANDSSSRPNPATAGGILLGLLLTVGLHFVFIQLLILFKLNAKPLVIISFTQLLYMLPTIYLSRDNRGLMIGLIIGAALTFMLGLPLAADFVLCGNTLHIDRICLSC